MTQMIGDVDLLTIGSHLLDARCGWGEGASTNPPLRFVLDGEVNVDIPDGL